MANSKDHYVQAAYMGLWSVHGPQNRKGRVQWMDKDSAATGWRGPTRKPPRELASGSSPAAQRGPYS